MSQRFHIRLKRLWGSFIKSDARQTLLAMIDQGIAGGMNFVTTVVIGRWCGPDDLGIFGLGLTVIFLLVATQDSLLSVPYTVFLARLDIVSRPLYRGSSLLCHFAIAGVFAAVLSVATLICLLSGVDKQYWLVLASLVIAVPSWLLRDFARRTAYAEFKLRTSLINTLTMASVQTIAMVVLVVTDRLSPTTGFLAIAFGNLTAGLTWLYFARHSMQFSTDSLVQTLRKHWTMGKVLSASQVVHTAGSMTIPWVVAAFLGTTVTGIYVACDQIIRFANPVIVGFMNVLTPRSAHAFADRGHTGMHNIVKRAMLAIGGFMFVFCGLIYVFGEEILGLMFGPQYAAYSGLLFVLSVSQAIEYLSIGPSRGLLVMERVIDGFKAGLARYAFSVIGTLLLISRFGVIGAAFGVLSGGGMYTVVTLGLYWHAVNSLHSPELD